MDRRNPAPHCVLRQIKNMLRANDNEAALSVHLPCDCEVADPAYVARVGKALVEFGKPRRQVAAWCWVVIDGFDRAGGETRYRDGSAYDLARLPDDPFGEDEAASNVRDMMGYAVYEPSRVRQECRDRARIISTALLIARPDLAWKYDL